MAYQATVIPVMIASPGDVFEEREVVREVVHTWNYINSLKNGVVLIPAGWETHSSPELGSRAQELINSRVLKDCDLLIGVFWTRLGTPTGSAESGTVEEIENHVKAGKPAMIYFSSKPVALQSIDLAQYQALQSFKIKCRDLGLVEEFENTIDFKEKFSRQLQLCLHNNPYMQGLVGQANNDDDNNPFLAAYINARDSRLSQEASVLLKEASKDERGTILKISVIGGRFIQAGSASFGGQGGRESARWESALNELVERNLVVARGYKGDVFELTHDGWALADSIPDDL
ncbi:hypothetical protein [Stutzerimonas stutzeri]|uniref:hypothetical protein n=1 Tax=Stutzerimonas stutzeri TaxID=316 RepID=UPI000364E8D1|nr:hypothetical protein [Stutzerimonas stutzeri]